VAHVIHVARVAAVLGMPVVMNGRRLRVARLR
jgi:hypothetical protein